uniref:Synaptobrevin, longin-like domain protein n=1 Tax=Tanacetum cinerariifolium TaxID=118510 RepID=A0A699I4X7_TANCI|nr:hypothetical protein [Tanacetum cinerariifolium]
MVAILEKGEHNANFHPIVDFIEASPLRYALTVKPTIYVSHIRQFWSTARIETTEEGTKILATVDGILRTVTESSLRRNLKLRDEEGISSLPDTELFENLTLMGYNISPNQNPKSTRFNEFSSNIATALVCLATNRTYNFSKMIFDGLVKNVNNKISKFLMYPRIVPLFDAMLVQQGKGSGTPIVPHHTPSPKAQSQLHTTHPSPTFPPVTTTSIPKVTPSDTPIVRQYTRRTRIAQSSVLLTVADEHVSPLRDVSQGEACPTDSGFIADQGSMQQTIPELTALCTSLQRQLSELTAKFQAQEVEINRLKERVKLLEDREGVAATRSGDDVLIKGRSMDEGEAATEKISDDSEEIATVLTSIDAATVLASRVVNVPTGSGSVPTASTPAEEQVPTGSDVVPTASPVFATATVVAPYSRRKGKKVMVESKTPKKQKIARDAEIARIHAEEELQIMIDGLDRNNETIAKYLQEYHQFASELPIERRIELITDLVKYQDNYAKIYKYHSQQRKAMTKKQKRDYYMAVIRNFIPMGSKEEAERIKRKGLNLEQESTKKQKTSEKVPEEAMSPEEVPEDKVKEMMQLVTVEEVYVKALQVKHHIINWKVYTEGQRSYWKITRLGGSLANYQFFIDLLKHLDREDLNQLWRLVKETLSNRPPTIDWRLYDTYGVHHVTAKDKEIFMLVEKDYPLRKALALVMICYKLQVENYSQMANDLVSKIYKIASTPRQQEDAILKKQQGYKCMRTKNSFYPNNSSVTIPRCQNKRRAPNVVEPELRTIVEVAPMANNRTMEELLQAPTEGMEKLSSY